MKDNTRLGGGRLSTRPLVALLILVMFCGLGYLVWWSLQPPSLQTLRLPNGARIALAAVTYGTNHEFDPAPPVHRLARLWDPQKAQSDIAALTTARPELRLWFSYRLESAEGGLFASPIYQLVEDEHGCPMDTGRFDSVGMYGADTWSSWAPSEAVATDRPFDYCGYDRSTHQEVFRFHIEPRAGPKSATVKQALQPKPLPQTVTKAELRATLVELDERREPHPHCRALIRAFDSKDAPLSPLWVAVEDGMGHRAESIGDGKRTILEGEGFAFYGLCRREPAWKLIATYAREPQPGAVPDRVWSCPRVAFGGKSASLKLGDQTLELRCLSEKAAPGSKAKRVLLWVHGKGFTTPFRVAVLRINGRDARQVVGSALAMGPLPRKPVLEAPLTPGAAWSAPLSFPIPEHSSTLTVTLGEYSGRNVEFVAAPP